MNRKRDLYLIREAYDGVVGTEELDKWLKILTAAAHVPTSYFGVETDTGAKSYGSNVTFDNIMRTAQARYMAEHESTLKELAVDLTNLVKGFMESRKVIDLLAGPSLLKLLKDPATVKYFVENYIPQPKPTPAPAPTASPTPAQSPLPSPAQQSRTNAA